MGIPKGVENEPSRYTLLKRKIKCFRKEENNETLYIY